MRRAVTMIGAFCGLCLLAFSFTNDLSSAGKMLKAAPLEEAAELSITADATPDTVVAGSNVTYTLTVTNEGPGVASAVTVADSLPDEATLVSCMATGGGVCGGEGNNRTVLFNSIAPDTSETITLVASVNCSLNDGTEIDNTASIRSSSADSDEDENETIFVTVAHPPPSITGVSANPPSIWPPDHKMINVAIDYQAVGSCGPLTTKLGVTSNEPVNGLGAGDTAPDWEIFGPHLVRLRAERAGGGSGRVYTVVVTATDSVGQSSSRSVALVVPKSQKK